MAAASKKGFLWHDPDVDNTENSGYQKQFQDEGFDVKTFKEYDAAADWLLNHAAESLEKWVVVTSGRRGDKFVPKIHDLDHVGSIIVFAGNRNYHEAWTQKYSKVLLLTKSSSQFASALKSACVMMSISSLLSYAKNHELQARAGHLLEDFIRDLDVSSTSPSGSAATHLEEWVHADRELGDVFILMMFSVLDKKRGSPTDQDVQDELKSISSSPDSFDNAWNNDWHAFPRAQKFTLGYTSNYFYRPLNVKLANKRLFDVKNYLSAFYHESEVSNEFKAVQWHGEQDLYRGFRESKVKLEDYEVGQTFYWPCFSSTSKSVNVALGFGGQEVLFVIKDCNVDKTGHPMIDVHSNPTWGYFGAGEFEVLLLPYACFEVIDKDTTRTHHNAKVVITVKAKQSVYNLEFLKNLRADAVLRAQEQMKKDREAAEAAAALYEQIALEQEIQFKEVMAAQAEQMMKGGAAEKELAEKLTQQAVDMQMNVMKLAKEAAGKNGQKPCANQEIQALQKLQKDMGQAVDVSNALMLADIAKQDEQLADGKKLQELFGLNFEPTKKALMDLSEQTKVVAESDFQQMKELIECCS
eukprot:TRINITY_DN23639_c0_g2_i3.p1 TRINITY_DN23639_c0_g2~~TRINITY_DN23639_c0_g2_i3.p1  ORF type:complete len:582 (+),score=139.86 TRINITY_DN23639_c0_g2_i3:50-1795(+)